MRNRLASLSALLAIGLCASALPAHAAPPSCDNAEVIGVVKDAFNMVQQFELNSPRRLASVAGPTDKGLVDHPPVYSGYDLSRMCQGRAELEDGETIDVWYRIYAKKAAADGEFGGVRPCFAKYNPPHLGEGCVGDEAADPTR